MNSQARNRRRRAPSRRIHLVERLEGRALLASIAEFAVGSGAIPVGITAGPNLDDLWYTAPGTDEIGRITTAGVVTEYALASGSDPARITRGPDFDLWYTAPGTDKIGRITTAGVVTEYALAAGSDPNEITLGPDGNLWFTEIGADKIGSIVPSGPNAGTVTEYNLPEGSAPWGITAGPDGNLWFTENGTNTVARIVPSGLFAGAIARYSLSGGAGPRSITTGSDGALWFVEETGNSIGRVTTGGSVTEFAIPSGSGANDIASGTDGALYFSKFYSDDIGRITTSGVFTSYPTPTMPSRPTAVALGPDGHIWFTESADRVGRLNLEPTAVADSFNFLANTPLIRDAASGVLANDADPEDDTLTVASLVSAPAHGGVALNADGSFTYTPDSNYAGPDSFSYLATDGDDNSNIVTVTLAGDTAPVAMADAFTTPTNTAMTRDAASGVLANDTDADGDPLSAVLVSGPTKGTLALNADGSFTYTPNNNYSGPDSFTYKASDGIVDSNTATVTIGVSAPPVAVADSYSTAEDTPLTVSAPGVLANDTDADGDPLTASLVAGPSNGTLTLNADGSFTYTPNANYNGPDSFTYRANDGTANGNTATVGLTVTAVNDAPVASDDAFLATEDTPLVVAAPGLLANDTDLDGDPLSAVLVAGPAHGTLTLNADGSFTYTPDANYNGADGFAYRANDGTANGNTVTVGLTVTAVNDAPVAVADSYSTAEDTPLVIGAPGVLGNDSDAEGDPLTASILDGPDSGSLIFNFNGSFTYTPDANFNGSDSFTYRAFDGTASGNAVTVTLTVTAANDAPVAVADSYSTAEDTPLTVAAPGLLANDTDLDGDPLSAVLVAGPDHGTLALNADGSFTYTPNANYNGPDSFTYRANDGTANGNTATVGLTVTAVNDAPVASDDAFLATEDTPLVVAAPGLLANDSDADGNSLTATLVNGPDHGTLTLNADGSFTYTPDADYNGPDGFTYIVGESGDGFNSGNSFSNIATVTLTVTAVNDAPTASDDSYSTGQDRPLAVAGPGLLGNDADVDGDPLAAVLVGGPSHGTLALNADGSFTYTPDGLFSGTDSFTYRAGDGTASSAIATVTLAVTPNEAPVAGDDTYVTAEDMPLSVGADVGLLSNASDPDGDPLTAVLVAGPTRGRLDFNADGSFTYTPDPLFSGTDSFTYRAFDGTLSSDVATITLSVADVNHAPTAVAEDFTTAEGSPLSRGASAGVLANDVDLDGDGLTAVLVTGPDHGTLTLGPDGSFTYTPDALFSGTDGFTYRVVDGSGQGGLATVGLTVTRVNHAPTAAAENYSATAGSPLTVGAPGLLARAADLDGDPLTAVLVASPAHGRLDFNADGSFTYTPDPLFSGTDSFTYRAFDGRLGSNVATVALAVAAAPEIVTNDFGGTGRTDLVVYIPSIGAFGIRPSGGGPDLVTPFGIPGGGQSIPAPGDYTGSGRAELAVYLPSIGSFAFRPNGGGPDVIVPFGIAGEGQTLPAPGDYFGIGQTSIAAYLTAFGTFAIRNPAGGPDLYFFFGIPGEGQSVPAPGDYDGDGRADLAVYMPSLGAFGIRPSGGGPDRITPFGIPGAGQSLPAPGDYDGDGRADLAVYLPSTGVYAYRPSGGGADVLQPFGIPGEGQTLPAPGDYIGAGRDQVAAYLPTSGAFAFRPGGGQPDVVVPFGVAGLGGSVPSTVFDQALAEMPSTARAASIAIPVPDSAPLADVLAPPTARRKKARKS